MRLLFIGEEQDALQRATTILRDEGFSVDAAETAAYGRFRSLNWDYDLIVLDVTSAGGEKRTDDADLRKRNRDTPVLILQSRDCDLNKRDSNANQPLMKPFARSELIGRVRAMLRQPTTMDPSSIEIGPVVIDRIMRTVTVDRNDVALTTKEYCLLEFLAVHRGTLISRTEIYDHLFDATGSSLSNLLDVYVCNIRRKLGGGFITTRRGVGYVIES